MNFDSQNPMSSFMGTTMGLQQLKQNQNAMQQQQQQQEAAKLKTQRLGELMPLVKSGDYEATIELATIDPVMSEAINKAKSNLSAGQDKEMANWISQYHSSPDKEAFLQQDNPNLTIDDNFRGMDPEQRDIMTRIVGSQLMPKEMFTATFGATPEPMSEYQRASLGLQRDQLNMQRQRGGQGSAATSNMKDYQYYQQLKQQDPQMAEEFAIKSGIKKVATPKGMSVSSERVLNQSQEIAYSSFAASDSLTSLADSYATKKDELGGGFFGSASEAFKGFVGGENEVTELKKAYGRLKNSQVIKSLPPGPATDKDVEMINKPFPGENANPEYIESFLRGMAKAEYINGRFNEFKAGYISENNNTAGMMKAWKEESKKLDGEIKEKFQSSTMDYSTVSDEDLFR